MSRGDHHSIYLQNSWNKYGADAFEFGVLEVVQEKTLLVEREQIWIDALGASTQRSGLNCSPAAGSTLGRRHTEKAREKMRKAQANRPPVTPETRAKLSASLMGRTPSEETKAKLRIASSGKKHPPSEDTLRKLHKNLKLAGTPESRAKVSASLRGRALKPEVAAKIRAALIIRNKSEKHRAIISAPKSPEHVAKLRASLVSRNSSPAQIAAVKEAWVVRRTVPGQLDLPL